MNERFYNYNPPVAQALKRLYEEALEGEMRWKGGWQVSEKEESDLSHVKSIFDIHDQVSSRYPSLFSEVDSEETHHMIYLHDAGEILAHDLSHSVPDYENVRAKRKKQEIAAFRLLTRKYIHDIELKEYARKIYGRYEEKRPDDKQAQYVQLIDKVQATRFGSVFVFPGRKLSRNQRLQQVNHIAGLYITPATKLFSLVSESAQKELLEFMDQEFIVLRKNGYGVNEVDPYRKLLHESLISTGNCL